MCWNATVSETPLPLLGGPVGHPVYLQAAKYICKKKRRSKV